MECKLSSGHCACFPVVFVAQSVPLVFVSYSSLVYVCSCIHLVFVIVLTFVCLFVVVCSLKRWVPSA